MHNKPKLRFVVEPKFIYYFHAFAVLYYTGANPTKGGGGGEGSTTTLARAGVPGSLDRIPDPSQSSGRGRMSSYVCA